MTRAADVILACSLVGMAGGCRPGGEEAAAAPGPASRAADRPATVLVELFTSQGCSSCPPADRLLTQLPEAVDGVEILPLAFHVDYWNDLGWRDPFSHAEWTARQHRYAAAIAGGRVYTPQLVVQGGAHAVGSSRRDVTDLIREAAVRPVPDGTRIAAARGPLLRSADRVTVKVDSALGPGAARADAWVALTESGLGTDVRRGENQGRELVNDFVVRRMSRAFRIEGGSSRRADVTLALEPGWRRERLGVTVFLQDPESLGVLAAAAARPR